MQAFGLYVAVMSQELGWSKTAMSGAAAMQSVEGALLGPMLGWLIDRYGARAMIRLGVIGFGLGFIGLGQVQTIAQFYLAIAVVALGASFCGYFPLSVAVIRWFHRQRARALSLMGLGFALGGTFVPAVAWFMQNHGWRATAVTSGALILLVGLPLSAVFRPRPHDLDEALEGGPPATAAASGGSSSSGGGNREFTAAQALRTRAFWLLAGGHGFALLVVSAVNVHAISHLKEGLGYSVAQASLVIMLMTGAQTGGVLLGSVIGDRFDKRYLAAGCMLMHGVGLLLLTFAANLSWVIAFAILHGAAWGLRGPLMQAMRADYFGSSAIGMIMGISVLVIAVGQMAGPMVAGLLADLTGNYRAGFTVLALVATSGSLLFFFARKPP
jgi:MFS family permease